MIATAALSGKVEPRLAEDEIGRFVKSANAELRVVEEGQHFLSASSPEVVNTATVEFIKRWK